MEFNHKDAGYNLAYRQWTADFFDPNFWVILDERVTIVANS